MFNDLYGQLCPVQPITKPVKRHVSHKFIHNGFTEQRISLPDMAVLDSCEKVNNRALKVGFLFFLKLLRGEQSNDCHPRLLVCIGVGFCNNGCLVVRGR